MSVKIKNAEEIEKMRVAGRLAAEVLEMIEPYVKPGVTTEELDQICHKHITEVQGAIPAPLNYHGYPKSICTSINHIVCHGIPATQDTTFGQLVRPAVLKDGDIINIDIPNRTVNVELSDEELAQRRTELEAGDGYVAHRDRKVSQALKAYAAFARSADKGATRDPELINKLSGLARS